MSLSFVDPPPPPPPRGEVHSRSADRSGQTQQSRRTGGEGGDTLPPPPPPPPPPRSATTVAVDQSQYQQPSPLPPATAATPPPPPPGTAQHEDQQQQYQDQPQPRHSDGYSGPQHPPHTQRQTQHHYHDAPAPQLPFHPTDSYPHMVDTLEITANESSTGQSVASSNGGGWLAMAMDWGPRAEKRPSGGPPRRSTHNSAEKAKLGRQPRRWNHGWSRDRSRTSDGSGGGQKGSGHVYYGGRMDGMAVSKYGPPPPSDATPRGGDYTRAEQSRRLQEVANDARQHPWGGDRGGGVPSVPPGEGLAKTERPRRFPSFGSFGGRRVPSFQRHAVGKVSSSDETLSDFDNAEWTPQDSAYGAACPVCGWIPKRIRQAIEISLIVVALGLAVFFIVRTSILLTNDHNGGSGDGSNSDAASSNKNDWSVNDLDDDFYIEYCYDDNGCFQDDDDDLFDDDVNAYNNQGYGDDDGDDDGRRYLRRRGGTRWDGGSSSSSAGSFVHEWVRQRLRDEEVEEARTLNRRLLN